MRFIKRFFSGRYGFKPVSGVLFVIAALIVAYNILFPSPVNPVMPFISAGILAVYATWRCLSRNIYRRRMEDAAFIEIWNRIKYKFRSLTSGMRLRYQNAAVSKNRTYKLQYKEFRCPKCRQRMRVPRHKGRVRITCRNCGEKFERKT